MLYSLVQCFDENRYILILVGLKVVNCWWLFVVDWFCVIDICYCMYMYVEKVDKDFEFYKIMLKGLLMIGVMICF